MDIWKVILKVNVICKYASSEIVNNQGDNFFFTITVILYITSLWFENPADGLLKKEKKDSKSTLNLCFVNMHYYYQNLPTILLQYNNLW